MTKTAAVGYEVRWRKNSDPADQWSSPIPAGADGHVSVPGLERVTDYTFEARAVSGCGAKSAWATQTFNLPDVLVGTITLAELSDEAAAAQAAADTANAQLTAIASDNLLSPSEKPIPIRDYSVILTEHAGIDAQADAYGVSRTAYDTDVSALSAYLAGLTSPTAWNDVSGNTTIDGPTFRGKFADVYSARQALLNAIYAAAKALADGAQNTANTAITQLGNLANSQYLQNPFFSTGDLTGWTSDHHTVYFESGSAGPATGSTSYAVFPPGTASEALRNAGKIPVYTGAVIKAQCAVHGTGSPNGVCGVRISWRGADDLEIGSTMTPTPSTGNATNGTYVTGTAPAGAMFAHVECATSGRTDTGGYYTVDNFAAWALADSLDQVPDGTTRFGAAEAGADKTAGKSLTVLTDRNLDNVADSTTYLRTIQQSQAEIVDNAGFEASNVLPPPGWNGTTAFAYNTGSPYSGSQSMRITASAQYQSASTTRVYRCTPGDVYLLGGALTGNPQGQWNLALALSNGQLPGIAVPAKAATWNLYSQSFVIPAGVTHFQIIAYYSGTSVPSTCGIDEISLARVRSLDREVQDGTTYGRTANADLYSSGGVNRVGLRIPGSGQTIGDQRNLQPITWASQRSVLSNSPISFSISGTTVTFSVAAVTIGGGGVSMSYAPSSGSVTQSAGTTSTWFLYYLDPTQSGGSMAVHITTNPGGAASFADSVFLGTASVTVASGGGGTGGTGGGGGGFCVADDMYIGEGRRAGDAEVGDLFDCIDLPTAAGKHVRALQGLTRGVEECVRMITSDGCALVCSISTPFDLPDGRNTTAPHMLGEQVITDLGTATVISLALVGPRPVTRAHLGGVSFAAGADPRRRIYSHNAGVLKP